ncbi:MAG: hypothetical protein QM820_14145 [Minicystis sp.]
MFHVEAWDVNCPQHIPQKLGAAAVKAALDERERRIHALEEENRRLRAALREKETEHGMGKAQPI